MRKTKIVCTLGPSTDQPEVVRDLMLAGMNVARFNFSHGDHPSHTMRYNMVVQMRKELGLPVATMLDTKGPEIRLGEIVDGQMELVAGDTFTLTTQDVVGDAHQASVSFKDLPGDVSPGTAILIDDGLIELLAERVTDTEIICKVVNGGPVSSRKSVNVPSVRLSIPYVSQKDVDDIAFGVKAGFDFVAASFVRSADDIMDVRQVLADLKCDWIRIIAKIENYEGVENIDEILEAADGLMVARGDLGVEIPLEDIPAIQKLLIKKTFRSGKPVITATQMLESMIKNPRPTRAEVTDIANAIYDGTSAIMLSGETAAGMYPVEAVKTMAKIAIRTEKDINYRGKFRKQGDSEHLPSVTNAISHATCTTAYDLNAKAVITVTKSGTTARMISKYRPSMPIIGCTPEEYAYRQLAMTWGVVPLMVKSMKDSEELLEHAVHVSQDAGIISSGDLVVITAGLPLEVAGTTNLLRVYIAGDILVSGSGIGGGKACNNLCVGMDVGQLKKKFKKGDILVVPATNNEMLPLIRHASGIVSEQAGSGSHAAVVGLALGIPTIVGANGATRILRSDTTVTLDADRGIVHSETQ